MAGEKMIKYFPLLVCLFLHENTALASDKDAEQYRIGKVVNITITKATERSDYNPQETCETFVMTKRLVKYFFRHAKVTSANSHHYSDDLS